jgi:probable F420-dependent oxidoreductase
MQLGVVFPQTEIGSDPGAIKAYAQAAEELGYEHLVVYDHVLGADTTSRPDWRGPYTVQTMFHEPMVLFGYLAAMTQRMELVTGILILPQRQTALVAKQASAVDVLSGGRLRLGIGIGWNDVEYEALGEDFHNRGRRSEEQVEVLRALWTQEVVTYEGRWHKISGAGLNPMPIQRPIPIWFGGGRDDSVLRRIAKLGDGWLPQVRPDEDGAAALDRYRTFAREAGRDPATLGVEGRVRASDGIDEAARSAEAWRELGATHLGINTMGAGYKSVDQHIEAIRAFRDAIGA